MSEHYRSHSRTLGHTLAVDVRHSLTSINDAQACLNRQHLSAHGVLCLHLISLPGAGHTSLLESLIRRVRSQLRVAIIGGNRHEAKRLHHCNSLFSYDDTGGQLDAQQLKHALNSLPLSEVDILFINSAGNSTCPAGFDLGQYKNIVLMACTESDCTPLMNPALFRTADTVLISKSDLLPTQKQFDLQRANNNVARLANPIRCLPISAKTGEGLSGLIQSIRQWLAEIREFKIR